MAKKPEWQSLESKLSAGKSLERACEETGVDIEAAKVWLESQRSHRDFDDDTLRIAAAEALHHGISKLTKASSEDRRISSENLGATQTSWADTDLEAAKVLLKFALDARKLLAVKRGVKERMPDGQPDLFDTADPWTFKESK